METNQLSQRRKGKPIALLAVLAAGLIGCDSGPVHRVPGAAPDGYPTRTITLICPWAAGGGTDRVSRFVAAALQQQLGKPVVVSNQTGGKGAVGHSAGALARPDGYTITMGTFELSTMHWMGISELAYGDFAPVMQLNADAAAIIVRADAPWQTLDDLMKRIKEGASKLKMSGTATGGAWDLARAGFLLAAKLPVDSVLWIPTQGSAPSLVQLMGGHIDAVCCSVPEAAPQIEGGELKVLAVMAPERLAQFPDIPTVKETGIDWEAVGWRGIMAPKATPPGLVSLLYEECQKIVTSEKFKEFMGKNGFAIEVRGPDEFAEFLELQDAQWKQVIAEAGYARN